MADKVNGAMLNLPETHFLRQLTPDGRLLFATRGVRLFAYGFVSVILVLYLVQAGLNGSQVGRLLTLTLVGDTLISLWMTTRADRLGRRRMLITGAALMLFAGLLFALTKNFFLLVFAATIGVISPSGNEVGPFLSIEQAALSQIVSGGERTQAFAWYNLLGSVATALGALSGGALAQASQQIGLPSLQSYRVIVIGYAALGLLLGALFVKLSPAVETPASPAEQKPMSWIEKGLGLGHSRRVVLNLSALFALDAFAGGFVVQSLLAYWFSVRFGVSPAALGGIFFGANLLAGLSALTAARVAARIGLVNTMVFTHLPSNLLLMLVPVMPSLPLAIGVLLVRFSISQMDVPTRQAYTMMIVRPEERSAAAGVTGVARTLGASAAPFFAGPLVLNAIWLSAPFFIAGALKIVYDLALYFNFRAVQPEKEEIK